MSPNVIEGTHQDLRLDGVNEVHRLPSPPAGVLSVYMGLETSCRLSVSRLKTD